MSFRKDTSEIVVVQVMIGINIIVIDNDHWTEEEIVTTSLDRFGIEQQFQRSKTSHHVRVNPMFH